MNYGIFLKNKTQKHQRRPIHLSEYDYSKPGAYFITVCVKNRIPIFGEIVDGEMFCNNAGDMIEKWYLKINRKFPNIRTDKFIIMPNHFHAVIFINEVDRCAGKTGRKGALRRVKPLREKGVDVGVLLHEIVQWFKTMTTNEYIRGVKRSGWVRFKGKLWQRSYYEHVVRNDEELNQIRQYIVENPIKWEFDRENPDAVMIKDEEPW